MGEFGSWIFWKRNPLFVLIFYLWENFCHWQFKGRAANVMSICCYTGIYDFIELGPKVCGGSTCLRAGEEKGEKKFLKKELFSPRKGESWLIFVSDVFPCTYGPSFGPYTGNLRVWPVTLLLRLTWFRLFQSEVRVRPPSPWSSRVTSREQQINPMCQSWHDTMFSRVVLFKYSHLFHRHASDGNLFLFSSSFFFFFFCGLS